MLAKYLLHLIKSEGLKVKSSGNKGKTFSAVIVLSKEAVLTLEATYTGDNINISGNVKRDDFKFKGDVQDALKNFHAGAFGPAAEEFDELTKVAKLLKKLKEG